MNVTAATPVEIDTVLADIYTRRGVARAALEGAKRGIYRALGNRITGSRQRVTVTDADVQTFRARVADDDRFVYREGHYLRAFDQAAETLQLLTAEEEPLQAEHSRRPWSRFFLVVGGHIHSSLHCSTCNRNGKATAFAWLPDLSGLTEEEAVAAQGAILCTTCYPSAPLAWTNFYDQEAERKAALYCSGSGTSDWKDGKVRNGFYSGNGGYCSRCGGWAGTTSRYSSTIRKHKPAQPVQTDSDTEETR